MQINGKWHCLDEIDYISQRGCCDSAKLIAKDDSGKETTIELREDDIVRLKRAFAACPYRTEADG